MCSFFEIVHDGSLTNVVRVSPRIPPARSGTKKRSTFFLALPVSVRASPTKEIVPCLPLVPGIHPTPSPHSAPQERVCVRPRGRRSPGSSGGRARPTGVRNSWLNSTRVVRPRNAGGQRHVLVEGKAGGCEGGR